MVKNLSAVQETLGREDPLEKEPAPHSTFYFYNTHVQNKTNLIPQTHFPSNNPKEPHRFFIPYNLPCSLLHILYFHILKAVVLPAVMYGCESWTIKKAVCQRLDAFELWCRRRFLRVPWRARRSNQSPKGDQPRRFIDAEAEAPILWPPDVNS